MFINLFNCADSTLQIIYRRKRNHSEGMICSEAPKLWGPVGPLGGSFYEEHLF
jgi:hypothetical protein